MKFSEFTFNRIPEVSDIFIEAFNAPPWNDNWTKETAEKRLKQQLSSPYDYGLICEIDGKIAGMIIGKEEQYCDEIHFTIKEFCTSIDFRGQGIGRKIIQELESRLKERGVHKIFLATIQSEGTVGVYQKMDFEISSDTVTMEKKI
ncbi:Acetyltransferase YpeA [Methanimicrococcus hongohii]|uniref:Acetyltransferase YpeA n=1 Tax=Methanimicrococcus hongohii TaxID=3028295 RepID=A0AA97A1X4_9EURY|nr:GNAT family N-acetyltransferase [Methanimicrococcus sp. Hf6]WNY23618.1 Acetyltransferase YpeA [Methanimicrococcus sp. Hf6]